MLKKRKLKPFIAATLVIKILKASAEKIFRGKGTKIFRTWSRASTIYPFMVGYTIAIHNGIDHIPVHIKDEMIGHKLGEFAPTRAILTEARYARILN
jgi:small subunit ribosomal protein S19